MPGQLGTLGDEQLDEKASPGRIYVFARKAHMWAGLADIRPKYTSGQTGATRRQYRRLPKKLIPSNVFYPIIHIKRQITRSKYGPEESSTKELHTGASLIPYLPFQIGFTSVKTLPPYELSTGRRLLVWSQPLAPSPMAPPMYLSGWLWYTSIPYTQ